MPLRFEKTMQLLVRFTKGMMFVIGPGQIL